MSLPRFDQAIGILAILASSSFAQQTEDWVGKRVITRFGTVLKVGRSVIDDEKRQTSTQSGERCIGRVYRAEKVKGQWVWLVAEKEGVSGWVKVAQVIPYDQAIDYFTCELRTNPDSSVYVRRGLMWAEKGEYDIAIADYNEAIRLKPNGETAWIDRGNAWAHKQEYDKAIADYNEAIRLDPKFAAAVGARGFAWYYKQEYDKAITDYNEAIRLDPKDASAFNNRGLAWSNKQEYDKAIADYNEAIRLDPKYATAFVGRGFAWYYKQEYDTAIADYNEAIRLDPKDAMAFSNRGIAWYYKKEYDKAIADYNEAIRLDPKDARSFDERAWIWATAIDDQVRDGKKVVESATRACELSKWKEYGCLDTLAAAHAEAGDFDAAVKWQEKAIELAKNDSPHLKDYRARLELYRAGKPYRDQPEPK